MYSDDISGHPVTHTDGKNNSPPAFLGRNQWFTSGEEFGAIVRPEHRSGTGIPRQEMSSGGVAGRGLTVRSPAARRVSAADSPRAGGGGGGSVLWRQRKRREQAGFRKGSDFGGVDPLEYGTRIGLLAIGRFIANNPISSFPNRRTPRQNPHVSSLSQRGRRGGWSSSTDHCLMSTPVPVIWLVIVGWPNTWIC